MTIGARAIQIGLASPHTSIAEDFAAAEAEAAAATAAVRRRVDAALDGARDVRDAAERLAMEGLRVFGEALASDNQRLRFQAAKELASLLGRLRAADTDKPTLTPDERYQALIESLENPDPVLVRALEAAGMKRQ